MLIFNQTIIKIVIKILTIETFVTNFMIKYYNILYAYHAFIKEID